MKSLAEQMIAELVGTLALVFIGAGSVILFGSLVGSGQPALIALGLLPIALAHGIVLAIFVSGLGHVSGGHFNPAVTVSIWVAGKIEALRAVLYVVAQLAGASLGALLLRFILPRGIWEGAHLGATLVNKASQYGFSTGKAVALEAVLTFFLVFTVFAIAVDERGAFRSVAGLPIGLVLTVDILVGGFFTGASMNPARSFGPALVSGTWTDFWVYVVGPITGGILAASLYWFAFLRTRPEPTVDYEQEPGELLITEDEGIDEPPYEQPRIPSEGPGEIVEGAPLVEPPVEQPRIGPEGPTAIP